MYGNKLNAVSVIRTGVIDLRTLTGKKVLEKLLRYGMFPTRLEKIFSSEAFAVQALYKLPFKCNCKHPKNCVFECGEQKNKGLDFYPMQFRHGKANNTYRYFGIPHPYPYYYLSKIISDYWNEIVQHYYSCDNYENISMITIKPYNSNKRLFSMESYDKNDAELDTILKHSLKFKYLVKADIENYYPSIYTHTIPWAIQGKKTAKKDRKHWSNSLDNSIGLMQSKETKGLPIGPDTSSIVAEIIASRIDHSLCSKGYIYIRHIDDYKCFCEDIHRAHSFINDLMHELDNFKLKLKETKTKIIELPYPIKEEWIYRLNSAKTFTSINKYSLKKFHELVDEVIRIIATDPESNTIRYFMKILSKIKIEDFNSLKQVLLRVSEICIYYPYTLDLYDKILNKNSKLFDNNTNIIKDIIYQTVIRVIENHTRLIRSDATIWALYLAIKYNINIYDRIPYLNDVLLNINDPLSKLIGYFYCNKYDTYKKYKYINKVNNSDISQWLYNYEICLSEGLNAGVMEPLRKLKVSFFSDEFKSLI